MRRDEVNHSGRVATGWQIDRKAFDSRSRAHAEPHPRGRKRPSPVVVCMGGPGEWLGVGEMRGTRRATA